MALESGNYITDLVITNPAGGDLKSTLDDHARLIKKAVKQSFPAISGAVTATHTELSYVDGVTSAIQTQIDTKATIASPTFTGTPAAPTAALGTSTTQLATTAFVANTSFSTNLPAQTSNSGKFLKTDGTNASWGGVTKTVEVLTSGTSWVCPSGVLFVTVHAQGGGGGGGRNTIGTAALGGAGGGYARLTFASVPATSYTISIGGGGSAATVDGNAGAAGSDTTFNTGAVTATGSGGNGGAGNASAWSIGGAATNGEINIRGGRGSSGLGGDAQLGAGGTASYGAAQGYGSGGSGIGTGGTGEAGRAGCIVLEY